MSDQKAAVLQRENAAESQLELQMQRHEKALAELSELVAQLERRLEKVLTTPGDTLNATSEPELMLVPLAEWQRSSTKQVHTVSERLQDLLSRIEL